MRKLLLALVLITATVGAMLAQAPAPPQPAAPPRGASGPPEHSKVTPINNLPNPYETVRNWGTLPDRSEERRVGKEGRLWGQAEGERQKEYTVIMNKHENKLVVACHTE